MSLTVLGRRSVNSLAAVRPTTHSWASTSRGNSGDEPSVAINDPGGMCRNTSHGGGMRRRRRRYLAEPVAGTCTYACADTQPHAIPDPDPNPDTDANAERRH